MRITSDHHGYQVKIHTTHDDFPYFREYLWDDGKVYRTHKAASNMVGKITCGLDDGTLDILGYRHCEIIEWFE